MMKKILILNLLILLICLTVSAQTNQQDLKREVTLYNPYKPFLPDFKKKNFLPDLNDTSRIRPDFSYDITTTPYTPEYTISPIKAVTMLPDPLIKLYKSYLNIGLGYYLTPLAELSITNERSKKGAIGFYASHFSTNGKIKLDNDKKVFAGYMDNDASFFGKKFFSKNLLEGSVDFSQKLRYAYGYDTSIVDYEAVKKEIAMGYNNFGTNLSFSSLTLDSSSFSYDFDLNYDFFYNSKYRFQNNIGVAGIMSKTYKGFYAGSGLNIDYFGLSYSIDQNPKYVVSLSPFVKKSTSQWNIKLGLQILADKNLSSAAKLHIYPDIAFGFSIVPAYIEFFAGLNGKLEVNEPKKIILENPFLLRDGSLFTLPNTNHALIVSAGLKGNTGIGGNYLVCASYSLINDMLFYANLIDPGNMLNPKAGNLFIPLTDDVELLRLHGEMDGVITDKISYRGSANWYKYTLTAYDYAWNKPSWDARLGIKYNLRDKIIAGADITATGKRKFISASDEFTLLPPIKTPAHININLNAEYRYTKILSFWLRLNNISFNRYYEWAYYPSQRFMFMAGFTYSL
jgi:hypothetical protein